MNAFVPAMDLRDAPANDEASGLPHNIEAEQALLGILLYDNAAFDRVDDLDPQWFYEPFHARLFAAIVDCVRVGKVAEPILLSDRFAGDPAFHELEGLRYLADLVDRAPPAANARDYAEAIEDTGRRRALMRIADEARRDALGLGEKHLTALELTERTEQELFALAEGKGDKGGFVDFGAALDLAVDIAIEAYQRDGGLSGLATDLIDLDQKIGGLHRSDLTILAGRPSMGKTALATNIGLNIAKRYAYEVQPDGSKKTTAGGIVAFYSLEMSKEQLGLRCIADVTGISGDRIRKGEVDQSEIGRIREARNELRQVPLYIDATGGISIAKLCARARRLKRTKGLDLLIIDYLQLITSTQPQAQRVQQITEITMALKALAKELDIPIIALSQLSRKVEERDDKRPQLADLRESGSIEQDADMVWFVFREAYYVGRAEPREGTPEHITWQEEMDKLRNLAELIIAKQRHGPIGTVRLSFNSDTTRFGNLAREHYFAQARDHGQKPASLPYRDDDQ